MADKRREIIATAAKLIHSKGYENTKLADILEAADIGKGQFYYYFASKHELGLAVLDHYFEHWNQRLLEKILGSDKSAELKINEMLEWVIEQHRRNQAKCGCVFGNLAIEMSEHDEAFREKVSTVFETWVEKLKLVLAGTIEAPSPADIAEIDKLAQGIVAMLEGGIMLMKSKQDINVLLNITDLVKHLVNTFLQSRACPQSI